MTITVHMGGVRLETPCRKSTQCRWHSMKCGLHGRSAMMPHAAMWQQSYELRLWQQLKRLFSSHGALGVEVQDPPRHMFG